LRSDILELYDFLAKNFKVNKFGVHGHSMGGLVACYLARNREVSFLLADRTFSSLNEIGKQL